MTKPIDLSACSIDTCPTLDRHNVPRPLVPLASSTVGDINNWRVCDPHAFVLERIPPEVIGILAMIWNATSRLGNIEIEDEQVSIGFLSQVGGEIQVLFDIVPETGKVYQTDRAGYGGFSIFHFEWDLTGGMSRDVELATTDHDWLLPALMSAVFTYDQTMADRIAKVETDLDKLEAP